ncbi:hypothetical protein FVR03_22760 [Pontibacter qinzhouensis]|uniref:Uncharacterized protein n=1 Tax=Pontibacter qinzhouensis TaxID=2603253 RepID=A0A5C8INM0_9BACT|nr:hypothetical protein [Pontibacter qinzhouensis]TXK23323.1 hypothetical protein FVR03_22760 [Pontibacter qinzhouensis]
MSFLITESYLKSRVNVTLHKDASAIKIAFQNVTDFYIQDLLSIPLYELYLDHATNNTALSVKQMELFNKIKVYFALMVEWELMFNLFEITNKGNKEDINAASIDVVKLKRNEVYSKAEQVKSNILRYLSTNKADFPQYFSSEENTEHTPKSITGASPIVFLNEPKIWIG